MDTELQKLIIIPVAIVVCLLIEGMKAAGIGKSKDGTKNYYPFISMLMGAVLNVLLNLSNITVTVIMVGIVSGWASNGLYDVIKNLWPPKATEETK